MLDASSSSFYDTIFYHVRESTCTIIWLLSADILNEKEAKINFILDK